MQILDNLIIISLIVLSFIAGLRVDNRYHLNALNDRKDALERQFVRLRACSDADDPVKPYVRRCHAPQTNIVTPIPVNTGDTDGDQLINQQFMDHLQKNGRASTKLNKSGS